MVALSTWAKVGTATTTFHALWPEHTQVAAELAQSKVDGGDADLQWRLDPVSTAERFTTDALGWQDVHASIPPGEYVAEGVEVKVTGSTVPSTCPTPSAACQAPSLPIFSGRSGSFVLQQLVRPGETGIWSVVSVTGLIQLPIQVGEDVISGQEISIPSPIPVELEGTVQVEAGYTYLGRCSALTSFAPVHQADGQIAFRVGGAGFEEGCETSPTSAGGSTASNGSRILEQPVDGYVFVELVVRGQHPIDPLTQHFAPDPFSFSAVPVRFVPASATPSPEVVPDVAQVSCDASATKLLTPVVAAQADGVHIKVENTFGLDLDLEFKGLGGTGVSPGTSQVVWSLRPGTVGLRCLRPTVDPDTVGGYVPLRVEDPQHLWVSPDLECTGGSQVGSGAAFPPGATGEKGDPVDIARRTATGLLASDVVQYAGYPKATERHVRVVRDGATVAVFHFMPDGHGGWLEDSYEACGDAGLSSSSGSG